MGTINDPFNDPNAFFNSQEKKPAGPRGLLRRHRLLVTLAIGLFILYAAWSWGFCRFYVPPGKMAIITAKSGSPLSPGQILAKSGQMGVQEEVLGEGRHIWNPYFYDWQIVDAQYIPPGKVGVVTSYVGDASPSGGILADPGQKGLWRPVLGPGRYRFNPVGYSIEIVDAVSIPVGFVGLVSDVDTAARSEAAPQGLYKDVLQPGLYYINPYVHKVVALEVGVNQVSFTGERGSVVRTKNVALDESNQVFQRMNQNFMVQQERMREEASNSSTGIEDWQNDPTSMLRKASSADIFSRRGTVTFEDGRPPAMERNALAEYNLNQVVRFPSRDGFSITLDMTVEFELLPENMHILFVKQGSLPEVVEEVLIKKISSVASLKGSGYRAVDFIAGEGREKFQNDLTDELKRQLQTEKLIIHSALIRNVNVPKEILEPLRVASLSRETELTNKEKQNTAKRQADLNRELGLIAQFGEQVTQETQKLKAQIKADTEKTVATVQAETLRQMAEVDKQTAVLGAERTVALGKADTEAKRMVEAELAKGFGMKVAAFSKNGGDYSLYEFANQLNPKVKINIIHAGEGTLWTDLKNASMAELGGAKTVREK